MQQIATESRYFNTAFEQNLELAKGFLALDYVVFQHMMFKMPRFASRIILLLRLKMFLLHHFFFGKVSRRHQLILIFLHLVVPKSIVTVKFKIEVPTLIEIADLILLYSTPICCGPGLN